MATKTLTRGKDTETNNIIDLFGEPCDFLLAEYVTDEAKREAVMTVACGPARRISGSLAPTLLHRV